MSETQINHNWNGRGSYWMSLCANRCKKQPSYAPNKSADHSKDKMHSINANFVHKIIISVQVEQRWHFCADFHVRFISIKYRNNWYRLIWSSTITLSTIQLEQLILCEASKRVSFRTHFSHWISIKRLSAFIWDAFTARTLLGVFCVQWWFVPFITHSISYRRGDSFMSLCENCLNFYLKLRFCQHLHRTHTVTSINKSECVYGASQRKNDNKSGHNWCYSKQ